MAYPTKHQFDTYDRSGYTSSLGASPVAAYVMARARAQLIRVDVVANGAITTSDCSIAVAINGTAVSGSPFILPVASAGAGENVTFTPSTLTYVNDGDYISFTPSNASGASIAGTFTAVLKGDRG